MLLVNLVVGHILGDFPLQGDFISTYKNRHLVLKEGQSVIWWLMLSYHAMIHGYIVYFITGNTLLGIVEALIHWMIDYLKMQKLCGFKTDQFLHLGCKLFYYLILRTL